MNKWLERLNPFSKHEKVEKVETEPKIKEVFYVSNAVSIVIRHPIDNSTKTIHKGNKNFAEIKRCLECGEYDRAVELIDIPSYIKTVSEGNVVYKDSALYWKDEKVTTALGMRIVDLISNARDGEVGDATKLMKFLNKLYENPSNRVYEQCFSFLDNHGFNFDDDGDILAYKRVGSDLYDLHSGTIKYGIGEFVEMNRRDVSDDPDNSCAAGIHFCTLNYVNNYCSGSGYIILMKIDPRDVVSIPKHEDSKGRCCKVKVLEVVRDDGAHIAYRVVDEE